MNIYIVHVRPHSGAELCKMGEFSANYLLSIGYPVVVAKLQGWPVTLFFCIQLSDYASMVLLLYPN